MSASAASPVTASSAGTSSTAPEGGNESRGGSPGRVSSNSHRKKLKSKVLQTHLRPNNVRDSCVSALNAHPAG